MIEGKEYIALVKSYCYFLIAEFDFKIADEKIRGNAFYDVQYKDNVKIVSVSYENIEDYFEVTIFILVIGELPNYDDKSKTLHLSRLDKQILSKINGFEIRLNNDCFLKFSAKNEMEKKLLKSARELRLCLKYL